MKLVIGETTYDAVSHQSASPLHLIELQQQSRGLIEGGLGMSRLEGIMRDAAAYATAQKAWNEAKAAGQDAGDPPTVPDDGVIAMAVSIFLARRRAGEKLTFEEAIDVTGVRWVLEPGDSSPGTAEEGEPDPTQPGPGSPVTLDGGRQDGDEAAAEAPGHSRT